MNMLLGRLGSVGCALVFGASVAACAPGIDDLHPPERDRTILSGEDRELTERLHLPIYDYRTNDAQLEIIRQAVDIHIERCMRTLGYDFTVVKGNDDHDEVDTAFFGPNGEYRRYGNVSLENATTYGFGAPDHLAPAQEEEEESSQPWIIDHSGQTRQDALDALFADRSDILTPSGEQVPEHGCIGWAQQQVDPHTTFVTREQAENGVDSQQPGISGTAEWIKNTSFEQMLDTPEVIDATAKWTDCMDRSGYPGEDFWLVGSSESRVATDDTVAAVTSVECKEEVGLINLMVQTETEIQVDLISQHENELLERYAQLEEAIEGALSSLEEDT